MILYKIFTSLKFLQSYTYKQVILQNLQILKIGRDHGKSKLNCNYLTRIYFNSNEHNIIF